MNGSNWNANSGENNVLNASGVALVKKVVGILKKLDEPETHLSETTLTATNASVGADRVSGSVTYTIPDGITLVNETSGKNGTGKVTLDGEDTFHLVVSEDYSGSMTETLTFQCKYAVDYSAYKLQLKGYQDIGFSYYSGKKSLTLTKHPKSMCRSWMRTLKRQYLPMKIIHFQGRYIQCTQMKHVRRPF